MGNEDRIRKVLNSLAEALACRLCGTRLRFGDTECPHCGADVDDVLRGWAERLIAELAL